MSCFSRELFCYNFKSSLESHWMLKNTFDRRLWVLDILFTNDWHKTKRIHSKNPHKIFAFYEIHMYLSVQSSKTLKFRNFILRPLKISKQFRNFIRNHSVTETICSLCDYYQPHLSHQTPFIKEIGVSVVGNSSDRTWQNSAIVE